MTDLLDEVADLERLGARVNLRLLAVQAETRLALDRAREGEDRRRARLAQLTATMERLQRRLPPMAGYALSPREVRMLRLLAGIIVIAGLLSLGRLLAGGLWGVEAPPLARILLGRPPAAWWDILREGLRAVAFPLAGSALWRRLRRGSGAAATAGTT
jgi:hypothetical protein